jgi:integrase
LPKLKSYLPKKLGKLIEGEMRKPRPMTRPERGRFLAALEKWEPLDGTTLPKGTAARFFTIMHYSLLRRGELFALCPNWIDAQVKLIRIPATDSKSGQPEEIPLHPTVRKALNRQIAVRGSLERDLPVFGTINVRKAFEWALVKAKIDRTTSQGTITPHHHARHTGATLAANETKDVLALQALGRWRSLRMVEKYTHAVAERARLVISKL